VNIAENGADNQRRSSLLGLWSETESRILKTCFALLSALTGGRVRILDVMLV
jgi:hypothetical protein